MLMEQAEEARPDLKWNVDMFNFLKRNDSSIIFLKQFSLKAKQI